jgi:hypothetical protein
MYATAVVGGKVVRFKLSSALARCDEPGRTLRVVLDTCILKLATFPARTTPQQKLTS